MVRTRSIRGDRTRSGWWWDTTTSPFPITLVRDASGWRFDTEQGANEIHRRRVGADELEAITVCRAYGTTRRAPPAIWLGYNFRTSQGQNTLVAYMDGRQGLSPRESPNGRRRRDADACRFRFSPRARTVRCRACTADLSSTSPDPPTGGYSPAAGQADSRSG
jgi:hypothetical protein